MAKQSGIHQLRGKVGEHSYYRQTGISSGLVRQINQGMSERVKTDAAYANTRLNNAEFGAAGKVASFLGNMVHPKFRPMILPFSQSTMAKGILALARQSQSEWGRRVVTSSQTEDLAALLTATSKKRLSDFVKVEVQRDPVGACTVYVEITDSQASTLAGFGADKINFLAYHYDFASGKYNTATGSINDGYLRLRYEGELTLNTDGSGNDDVDFDVSAFAPTPELYYGHQFVVVVAMPVRTIAGVEHILQEHCMFAAYKLPNP